MRIFLLVGFLLLTTNSALAQSAGGPFVSWSGPYAGLNAGYAGGDSDQTDSGFPASVASAPATSSPASAPSTTTVSPPPFHFESDGAGFFVTSGSTLTLAKVTTGPGVITLTGDGHYSVGGGLIGDTLEYLHADFGSAQLFDIVPKIPLKRSICASTAFVSA